MEDSINIIIETENCNTENYFEISKSADSKLVIVIETPFIVSSQSKKYLKKTNQVHKKYRRFRGKDCFVPWE